MGHFGMDVPDVRYARNGDLAVAYSVSGGGPIDIVLLAMTDHWLAHSELFLGEIEEFLTCVRRVPDTERVLATVVFGRSGVLWRSATQSEN